MVLEFTEHSNHTSSSITEMVFKKPVKLLNHPFINGHVSAPLAEQYDFLA